MNEFLDLDFENLEIGVNDSEVLTGIVEESPNYLLRHYGDDNYGGYDSLGFFMQSGVGLDAIKIYIEIA